MQEHRLKRKESARRRGAEAGAKKGRGSARNRLLLWHYWHRLLGAAIGWFAWDFYYCERLCLSCLCLACPTSEWRSARRLQHARLTLHAANISKCALRPVADNTRCASQTARRSFRVSSSASSTRAPT